MDEKMLARFWSKVEKRGLDECWRWKGGLRNGGGYGAFMTDRPRLAHRVAWEIAHGEIPRGKGYHGTCVCHRCDNRLCCNPNHLFLGTHADNMRDMKAKGRRIGVMAGERNFNAKLSGKDVDDIRAADTAKFGSKSALARTYGVTPALITAILHGRAWKRAPRSHETR